MNLIRLSIQRPIFIFMLTLFFVVVGGLALRTLPVDLYPEVSYPVLSVRATLPGASPEEMEQLVTKPLEDALSSLPGIDLIRSSSREGTSIVTLEYVATVDIKFEEMQVRAKVANIRRSLPEDMTEPIVARQDPDDTPIIELAISGNRSASELTKIVDDEIAERLRQIPGVGEVEMGGERMEEIHVDLRPEAIEAWRLSATEIVQAIRAFNGNEPIGKLKGETQTWLLRSPSIVKGVAELRRLPVGKTAGGDSILLQDVADVTQGFAEVRRLSRIREGKVLRPAIDLDIKKQSGENTVAVSDSLLEAIDKLQAQLPSDIIIAVTRDNADLIRRNVADVVETLIIGAFLTVAVVLIFLRSPRATLTTAISLPSSVITTFAAMAIAGFTINTMTLLALSLAIGLLVDDAIVVRENIYRHLQDPTIDAREAAYRGTKEVALAVLATTLTIVAVFLPVGFMGGAVGQFFKQFAVTVVFAILVSLWDALTMAPMLSAHFAYIADPVKEWKSFGRLGLKLNDWLLAFEEGFEIWEKRYKTLLNFLLQRPIVAIGLILASLLLAVLGFLTVSKSFLPAQLGPVFSASLNGPLAVPVEEVNRLADEVDRRLQSIDALEFWTMRAGTSGLGSANIQLTLAVKDEAAKDQESLAAVRADLRKRLQGFIGYSLRVSEPSDPLSGSTGRFQPVAVVLSGQDNLKLRDLGREIQALMAQIPGITDLSPIQDAGLPEVKLKTLPEMAGHFAVTAQAVSEELRIWIEGDTSNHLQRGIDQIPIRVRMLEGEKQSMQSLLAKSVFVRKAGTAPAVAIPIGSFVETEAGAGPSVINRENRQKILRIGANIEQGAALGDIVSQLRDELDHMVLPEGYRVQIAGQSEQMDELFSNIVVALLLGCLFMYMILASLFESFSQAFTVMAAVPLAATGAVLALLITGKPLDLYGGIGMILLAGIVAKNSILLVDFAIQKVRDENMDPKKAILETAPLRLRPIIMTSLAMIVGMLPVATGLGAGGSARQALGIATTGGIISSTVLTLLIVPNLYVLVERLVGKEKGKNREGAE